MAQQTGEQITGTKDKNYDLISVIYHALEAGIRYDTYTQDAEQAGDQELAQFFREIKERSCKDAERAQHLLAQRIG